MTRTLLLSRPTMAAAGVLVAPAPALVVLELVPPVERVRGLVLVGVDAVEDVDVDVMETVGWPEKSCWLWNWRQSDVAGSLGSYGRSEITTP